MINFGVTERKSQELQQRMHNCKLLENHIEEPTGNNNLAPLRLGGRKIRLLPAETQRRKEEKQRCQEPFRNKGSHQLIKGY